MASKQTEGTRAACIMNPDVFSIIGRFADASRIALQDNLIEEYLFGSYASRTQTLLSDIDILIIVKTLTPVMQSALSGIASEYALQYGLCISPIMTDLNAWEKNRRCNTLFYQEISRNGIRL